MNKPLPGLTLLVKPASSLCGMRCAYCFYADEAAHRLRPSIGLMTEETAARLIDAAFAAVRPGGPVSFAFQGGEPTLAGPDFFRRFCEMADAANAGRHPLSYSIQTNGLLIDEAWADLLRERGFLVGVSVDGPEALHNECRRDARGAGTWERAVRAVKLLRQRGAEVNLLCVVHARTAGQPKKVYRALRDMGTGWLQFIPCLDPLQGPPSGYSLKAEDYGRFLCGVFDCW